MSKTTQRYANRKHYDKETGQLVDTYPGGLSPAQYYRRNKPYQPQTLEDALLLIHNLRADNKRLRTQIKNMQQAT